MKRKQLPFKIRKYIYSKYNGICFYCGEEVSLFKCDAKYPTLSSAVDHIIPVKHGGTDNLSNLQLLCCSCNGTKSSKQDYHENMVNHAMV